MMSEQSSEKTALGVSFDVAKDVGKRLKATRETVNKTPAWMASRIKVREHYIVAIEDGRWNDLPSGLHGRGLVRIYAKELGVAVPELEPKVGSVTPAFAPVTGQNSHVEDIPIIKAGPRQSSSETTSPSASTSQVSPTKHHQRIPLRETLPRILPNNEEMDDETPLGIITPDINEILGLMAVETKVGVEKSANGNSKNGESVDQKNFHQEIPSVNAKAMAEEIFGAEVKDISEISPNSASLKSYEITKEPEDVVLSAVPSTQNLVDEETKKNDELLTQKSKNEVSILENDHNNRYSPVSPEISQEQAGFNQNKHLRNERLLTPTAPQNSQTVKQNKFSINYLAALFVLTGVIAFAVVIKLILVKRATTSQEIDGITHLNIEPETLPSTPETSNLDTTKVNPTDLEKTTSVNTTDKQGINLLTTSSPFTLQATPPQIGKDKPLIGKSNENKMFQKEFPAQPIPPSSVTPNSEKTDAVKSDEIKTTENSTNTPEKEQVKSLVSDTKAALFVLHPVKIQISTDGERYKDGIQQPGRIDIKFKSYADLLIDDGSKVSMVINSWNHGPLGHPGRKRKIRLHSQPLNLTKNMGR